MLARLGAEGGEGLSHLTIPAAAAGAGEAGGCCRQTRPTCLPAGAGQQSGGQRWQPPLKPPGWLTVSRHCSRGGVARPSPRRSAASGRRRPAGCGGRRASVGRLGLPLLLHHPACMLHASRRRTYRRGWPCSAGPEPQELRLHCGGACARGKSCISTTCWPGMAVSGEKRTRQPHLKPMLRVLPSLQRTCRAALPDRVLLIWTPHSPLPAS